MTSSDKKADHLKKLVGNFPTQPGVYLMKNEKTQIIYVGKAKDLRARVRSYFQKNKDHSVKTKHLVSHIDHIDYVLTATEVEAFLLEASLIKKHKPRYNIRLKDDKSYPYLKCDLKHDFPKFEMVRKVKNDGAQYFGPYTSGFVIHETINFININFKIRDCSDSFMKQRSRPCMTYQIGRCTAPCVDFVNKKQYREQLDKSLEFLRRKDMAFLKQLKKQMQEAAQEERFEKAAQLRDSLEAVKRIWQKQTVVNPNDDSNKDVFAYVGDHRGVMIQSLHVRSGRVIGHRNQFLKNVDLSNEEDNPKEWFTSYLNQYYAENVLPEQIILPVDLGVDILKLLQAVFLERHGHDSQIIQISSGQKDELMDMALQNAQSHFRDQTEKQETLLDALATIQKKLHLPEMPRRIECFDISNFQGEETVASQVVFEDGRPKRDDYRRYKIQTVSGIDDFASMKEVLSRRFKHVEYDDPQLILVDGGKGQLSAALRILKEIGFDHIPLAGLAKARTKGEFEDKEIKKTEERFFLPGRSNPIVFAEASQAFQILVGIRDEAHRFAITYHRKLRDYASLESRLDQISGLGKFKKSALLRKFGSVENIKKQTPEEIAKLKYFNLALAQRILNHLK